MKTIVLIKQVMILLVVLAMSVSVCAAQEDSIRDSFNKLYKIENSQSDLLDTQRARLISKAYANLFSSPPKDLSTISDDDLKFLFYAANIASFYTFNPKYTNLMERYLSVLSDRKMAPKKYYLDTFGSLVSERRFLDARAFASKNPQFEFQDLPKIVNDEAISRNTKHSALVLIKYKNILKRKPVYIDSGPRIVMIAHPSCHFSQNAISAIKKNVRMSKVFEQYATIVSPTTRYLNIPLFQQWNVAHPKMPMLIAYKESEWPMFNSWETPTFYFFRDGRLITEVVGWPSPSQINKLMKASESIGAIRTSAQAQSKGHNGQ